jgi:hypothetical protein
MALPVMELELKRHWLTLVSTIGELFLNRVFECFILEDRYRPPPEPKVPGQTCIPIGRYRVLWTWSPRFQRKMLLVDGVPQFQGIRMHGGNRPEDTEGCLLTGRKLLLNEVLESQLALKALEAKVVPHLEAGGEAWLTVSLEPRSSP